MSTKPESTFDPAAVLAAAESGDVALLTSMFEAGAPAEFALGVTPDQPLAARAYDRLSEAVQLAIVNHLTDDSPYRDLAWLAKQGFQQKSISVLANRMGRPDISYLMMLSEPRHARTLEVWLDKHLGLKKPGPRELLGRQEEIQAFHEKGDLDKVIRKVEVAVYAGEDNAKLCNMLRQHGYATAVDKLVASGQMSHFASRAKAQMIGHLLKTNPPDGPSTSLGDAKINPGDQIFKSGARYHYVGIAGVMDLSKFDVEEVRKMMVADLLKLREQCQSLGKVPVLVSGMTNSGVPSMAYHLAAQMGFLTIGVACQKVYDHPQYPVDKTVIVGEDWGDESPVFLDSIDCLYAYGGDNQIKAEVAQAKKKTQIWDVVEHELPPAPEGQVYPQDPKDLAGLALRHIELAACSAPVQVDLMLNYPGKLEIDVANEMFRNMTPEAGLVVAYRQGHTDVARQLEVYRESPGLFMRNPEWTESSRIASALLNGPAQSYGRSSVVRHYDPFASREDEREYWRP